MSKENGNNEELVFNIGETIAGHKLIEKIDEGGFGQVWKCTKKEGMFAIKLESSNQEGGSAIKLEINVLKQLSKGNSFPKFICGGRKQRYHYLVLELLGESLKKLKSKCPNPELLSDGTWSRIGIQCLYALKEMHNYGFVHRDIKPSNFAIGVNTASEVRSRRILLFDFGLARKFVKADTLVAVKLDKNGKPKTPENPKKPEKGEPNSRPSKIKVAGKTTKNDSKKANQPQKEKLTDINNRLQMRSVKKKSNQTVDEQENEKMTFRIARPHTDFRGTTQYASPRAHAQIELGRHDDIWSLMYMIAEMFLELPWTNNEEIPVSDIKEQSTILRLFSDEKTPTRLTSEMQSKLEKIDKMLNECNYYSHPNYQLVHDFFLSVMVKSGVTWSTAYDWEIGKSEELSKMLKKSRGNTQWEKPDKFFVEDKWADLKPPSYSPCVSAKQSPAVHNKSVKPTAGRGKLSREDSQAPEDENPIVFTPTKSNTKPDGQTMSKKSSEPGKR